ncbi:MULTISPECIES: hypothetical protein [unclassified Streptomyces]|uniref:hypothetical protein n=1 Tax=unclassified Streptomyces TaxID=2593676 RepID=UPI00278BC091|nr:MULTISPECIES: hypothetical protein [unclassified Streptomyces]
MRTYQRAVGVFGAGMALVFAMSGSASAGTSSIATDTSHYGSIVNFIPDDEWVSVRDEVSDGHSAVGLVDSHIGGEPRSWTLWNAKGSATQQIYDLNIAEGEQVVIQACLGEYGSKTILWSTCGDPDFSGRA